MNPGATMDDWKSFQDLVGRIEQIAAPTGAIVKSPDRVPDLETGSSREVDASIRFRVGTAEVLITVECRRRSSKQDATWIEELAGKKQSIGAAATVAVSATGFHETAIAKARLRGIQLRQLAKISDDEIRKWLAPVVHVKPHVNIIVWDLTFVGSDSLGGGHTELAEDVVQAIKRQGVSAKVFRSHRIGGMLCLDDLLHLFTAQTGLALFDHVPEDGTSLKKEVQLEFEPNDLTIRTRNGWRAVRLVQLLLELRTERTVVLPALAVRYQSPDLQTQVHHGQFDIDDGSEIIRLTFQSSSSEDVPSIGVELAKKGETKFEQARLEFIRGSGSNNNALSHQPTSKVRIIQPETDGQE